MEEKKYKTDAATYLYFMLVASVVGLALYWPTTRLYASFWFAVGLGTWLGIVLVNVTLLKKYEFMLVLTGIILTLIAWPVAIYCNYNHYGDYIPRICSGKEANCLKKTVNGPTTSIQPN